MPPKFNNCWDFTHTVGTSEYPKWAHYLGPDIVDLPSPLWQETFLPRPVGGFGRGSRRRYVTNPYTGRKIKVGGRTYKKLFNMR